MLTPGKKDSSHLGNWQGQIVKLFNGLDIEVDPRDFVCSNIVSYGVWESDTVFFFQRWLKPGMTFIDAGAHIGQYSMIASLCVGPEGRVHAFEPHPGLFDVLERNIKRLSHTNVITNWLALGRITESRQLYLHSVDNLGSTSLIPDESDRDSPTVPVKVIPLDEYVTTNAIQRIDLLKIDVEGAELEALEGAQQTLENNQEIILMVEFYDCNARRFGHSLNELESWLRKMGFHLYSISFHGLVPYAPIRNYCQNVVATRQLANILRGLTEAEAAQLLMRLAKSNLRVVPYD